MTAVDITIGYLINIIYISKYGIILLTTLIDTRKNEVYTNIKVRIMMTEIYISCVLSQDTNYQYIWRYKFQVWKYTLTY